MNVTLGGDIDGEKIHHGTQRQKFFVLLCYGHEASYSIVVRYRAYNDTTTKLIRHRNQVSKMQNKSSLVQAEINLFLLSLVMFISQFLLIAYDVIFNFFVKKSISKKIF